MPAVGDIRSVSVKLLKTHSLRFLNMQTRKDPSTGIPIITLKFRRDKSKSPKSFFDDLNEHGIQYKKLVKNPEALEIVCELWPKGAKRVTQDARDDAKGGVGSKENSNDNGTSNGNLNYLEVPPGGASLNMIESVARDLIEAGYVEDGEMLLRKASQQDWDDFRRKVNSMLVRMKLHLRPEIRQIREQIATEIVKDMGTDSFLYKSVRGSDLQAKIDECLHASLDVVLDTRSMADSILRRIAHVQPSRVATLISIKRGLVQLSELTEVSGIPHAIATVASLRSEIENDMLRVANNEETKVDLNSPLLVLVSERNIHAAYLSLLEPTV